MRYIEVQFISPTCFWARQSSNNWKAAQKNSAVNRKENFEILDYQFLNWIFRAKRKARKYKDDLISKSFYRFGYQFRSCNVWHPQKKPDIKTSGLKKWDKKYLESVTKYAYRLPLVTTIRYLSWLPVTTGYHDWLIRSVTGYQWLPPSVTKAGYQNL